MLSKCAKTRNGERQVEQRRRYAEVLANVEPLIQRMTADEALEEGLRRVAKSHL
jgi:hypothetical protein